MRREFQVEPLMLCLVQPAPSGTRAYKPRSEEKSLTPEGKKTHLSSTKVNSSQNHKNPTQPSVSLQANSSTDDLAQSANKNNEDSKSDEPSGRTRRRRSAIAS